MVGPTFLILALLLVVVATRFGSVPERMMAWSLLLLDALDHANHWLFGPTDFVRVDPGHLVISSLGLAIMLWIGLRANRVWPLPICSLQLITVSGHLAVLAAVPGINVVYWAMNVVPGWLQFMIVVIGIAAHTRRHARLGPYRDWRRGLTAFSGQLAYR